MKNTKNIILLILKGGMRLILFTEAVAMFCSISFILVTPIIIEKIFNALENGTFNELFFVCLLSLLIISFVILITSVQYIYADAWESLISYNGTVNVYKSFMVLPYHEVNSKFSEGELFNRITNGCMESISLIVQCATVIASFIAACITIIFLFQSHYIFALLALIFVFTEIMRMVFEGINSAKFQKKQKEADSEREQYLNYFLVNIQELQMLDASGVLIQNWEKSRMESWMQELNKSKLIALCNMFTDIVSAIIQVFMYQMVSGLKITGSISIAAITFVITLFERFKFNMKHFRFFCVLIPPKFVAIKRLSEILSISRDKHIWQKPNILLENVSLSLGNKLILKNINLQITRGCKVAIIGKNGSGKTSLLKTIMGMYQITDGILSVEGEDTSTASHEIRRKLFSYIPINPQLFTVSIAENIKYNMDRHDVFEGEYLDFGESKQLSGGQAQRVNIQRALSHKAYLLVADEPTSALNDELAYEYLQKIANYPHTVLMVTHNLKHLKHFDKIILMDSGSIILEGSYDHVVNSNIYKMWANNT